MDTLMSKYEKKNNSDTNGNNNEKLIYSIYKRMLDILASIIGLIIGIPLIVIFGLIVKMEDRGPIFYKQERLGKNLKVFYIYKIRSMRVDAEKIGGAQWAQKDDPRITKTGKFIRKTRIDEIPQLFNILKGDMSLIGPRPERPELTYKFEKEIPGFIKRLKVKPGLTGLAQVNGGYEITPNEKLKWDLIYIKNRNIIMDIKIILKTVRVIFTGDGAR
ncbi:MAG: exopolysaccharide biosynthesis polyprenyl glycosylphosphotransferase [Paraclostridium sordellii]|uniref:exopolysaccharide biosynthesis polyprenyl glycosylphosphotransferase n=1 Tax=Paraclostridium sordellii TaxID=1505 RepID=UPI000385804A|nr:exopolysaccharide biosynthesis polyprenyl glycosylphosphotransferase [Paeniclostridium sordellii]EPZ57165.1 exopolysaccharide biosynthesis polyprenyl glycosylphosphotransferase family protein [[Clostridium] sordellii VPI 9048] [Paeniclostridium sordellii VPI 9048]CEK39376.1 putative glycosyl transferase [[Clostridium] sordellii] [Paeniclostridium sordellii]